MNDQPNKLDETTENEDKTNKFPKNDTVYILITQCLQNGFLLAHDSRLVMDDDIVAKMLLKPQGNQDVDDQDAQHNRTSNPYFKLGNNKREIKNKKALVEGPLYQFLSHLMDDRDDNTDTLHAIHLRDWHKPSRDYDLERASYGPHCEAGTWESEALDNFDPYLAPWILDGKTDENYSVNQQKRKKEFKPDPNKWNSKDFIKNPTQYFVDNLGGTQHTVRQKGHTRNGQKTNVVHYPVLSDSVFDFRRADTIIDNVYDSENRSPNRIMEEQKVADVDSAIKKTNPVHRSPAYFELLINSILNMEQYQADHENRELRVNIVVIGVYTDIKVRTLVTGLRSRYRIANLVVSDVLTAAPSLERHLEALDFMHKVLRAEIIHSLNDLINVLAPSSNRSIDADIIMDHVDFVDYASYYQNKQNFLAYQDTKRLEYLELTRARSRAIYKQVYDTNKDLMRYGKIFLGLTALQALIYVGSLPFPSVNIPPEAFLVGGVVTGGLSMLQVFTSFFRNPLNALKDNLQDLIQIRSELETHSLILALVRYHFSTPERLSESYVEDDEAYVQEMKKLKAIEKQIKMIEDVDFKKFQYRLKQSQAKEFKELEEEITNPIPSNVTTEATETPPTSAG